MKKALLCLILLFCAPAARGNETLQPEPLDQAVKEYDGFWKNDQIDPSNHQVWKVYLYYTITPIDGFDKTPKWLVAGLTPKRGYRVMLRINQLYNLFRPIPKAGDILAVEGRVMRKVRSELYSGSRESMLSSLYFYVEGASKLPSEPGFPVNTAGVPSTATPPAVPVVVHPTAAPPAGSH